MRTIPQEIVDMVIDQLADQCELQSEKIMILEAQSPPQEPTDMATGQLVDHEPQYRSISYFSTVSRHWLARTQKYHFESVWFMEEDYPERWRANIEPNPSGVSRYVRELRWIDFDDFDMQVKDFDAHLRAFTRIEVLVFDGGDILLERSAVEAFAPMGSSLVRLEVDATSTTLKIFASLLAALPRLRHLRAHRLGIYQDDDDKALFPPRIPFFENANSLDLLLDEDSAGPLDWIPPSVRFHDLRIDTLCIIDERGRVEGWIASSASNLKYFSISEHVKGTCFNLWTDVISNHSLTMQFSSRPPFSPTGPLGMHWARDSATGNYVLTTWGTRRHRHSLPPLSPASENCSGPWRNRFGYGGRLSGLGFNRDGSLSAGRTVQDHPRREKDGGEVYRLRWVWPVHTRDCGVV